MKNKLVSIIVPVYNVELYLEECIESLINQIYKEIEIILVDDGSTDRSSIICDSISKKDSRVIVIHKKNGGLSSARNVGIEKAKGKYLLFVDSDDFVSKYMVNDLVEIAEKYGYKMVVSPLTSNVESIYSGEQFVKSEEKSKDILKSFLEESSITTSASGKLYDSFLWNDIRFPEGIIFEDFATIYKVVIKCEKIGVINSSYYYYRLNPSGIMNSTFNEKKMDYYDVNELLRQELIKLRLIDLIPLLNNRMTRYSISFFRAMSMSNYDNEQHCRYITKIIRKHILKYLFSNYKISSKLYGMLITVSPQTARRIFESRVKQE